MTPAKEEILGKILQEEGKAKQISQEKLVILSSLDRTVISIIENGKRSPTLTGLAHAARGGAPMSVRPLTLSSYRLVHIVKQDCPFLP